MKVRTVAAKLLLLLLPLIALAATAEGQFATFHRICFEEFLVEEVAFVDRIPVGCEVVDCCPGCPGPPLDLVIRFESEVAQGVALRFDNLPFEPQRLQVEGARWQGDRLIVRPGTTTIRGLPLVDEGRPPVIVPEVLVAGDEATAAARAKVYGEGDEPPAEVDLDGFELTVEQRLGRFVVNSYRAGIALVPCVWPLQDRIDLDNNSENDSAVVLVDGRRSTGCVNDQPFRGSNVIGVGSLLSPAGCRQETVVFSDGDAMQIQPGPWTNPLGDVQVVDQTPDELRAPVSVWLLRPGAGFTALFDVIKASNLYDGSNCGSAFTIGSFLDRSGNPAEVALVPGTAVCSAAGIAALQASTIFTSGRLNAYYINGAFTAFNCVNQRNISVVGTLANNQSLAHEFGHAYSIGHTNSIATIPASNVMHGGGSGRTDFTEGQCFRTNVNPGSMLNANGVRSGPTRSCPDGTSSSACPRLDLDVDPD